ncbi:MAG: hypothetical protein ACKPJD_04160, partial [Planctomycetaceae bacterium]
WNPGPPASGLTMIGAAAGLLVLLLVQFSPLLNGPVIAWPWLALIGASTTFAVGLLVSEATGSSK